MSTIENKELINKNNLSTKYGLIAGGAMALFLIAFQASGNDFSPFMKLSKYLILGVTIIVALNLLKKNISGDVFVRGIGTGMKLSLIAGAILVIINFLLFFIAPDIAFSKYSIEPSSLKQVAMISGVLFFETIVFGSLITFAVLQFTKGKISQ